ncbi:ThiF family adenylyltransferase [Corynebacterium bovis]
MAHPGHSGTAPSPRPVTLPGFGVAGQAALARAHVAVVGAGGLGSPALLYLAAPARR